MWICESTLGVKSVRELLLVIRHFLKDCVIVVCLVAGLTVITGKFMKGSNPFACLRLGLILQFA